MMKKRLIALLLACCTLLSTLSGCGSKNENSDTITQGELLTLICDAFGMYDYSQAEPHLASVGADDPYFAAVQMCVEWEIISEDQQDYDVNAEVTRGALALAVVNAAELTDLDASDEEKLAAAAEYALVETSGGKIKEKKVVTYTEAAAAVAAAANLWSNREYTESVQELDLQEGVQDLRETEVQVADNVVYVPTSVGTLKAGDAFVYQGPDGYTAAKIASVTEVDGYYAIVESDEDFDLEDIAQDIQVQETYSPDLTAFTFVDGAGNVYEPGSYGATGAATEDGASTGAEFLNASGPLPEANGMLTDPDASVRKTLNSGSLSFTVGDVTVTGKTSKDAIEVSVKSPMEQDDKGNQLSGWSGSLSLSNIKLTNKVDYGVLKGLKSVTSKVDYTVKISGGVSMTWADIIAAPYNNGNGKFLTNLKKGLQPSNWRSISDKGASSITGNIKSIKIGSWTLLQAGIAQVKLELKLNFKVTGEVTASLQISGAKGIEYRNGNIRAIKENSTDLDVQFKCKAELTAGPGFSLKILNKWEVVSVSAQLGVGVEASATVHMIDTERHLIEEYSGDDISASAAEANSGISIQASPAAIEKAAAEQGVTNTALPEGDVTLFLETCFEVRPYWILKLSVAPGKILKKYCKGFDIDILKADKAEIAKYHVEDFDFLHPVSECTKVYTPFAYLAEEENTDVGAQDADQLDLNAYILVFTSMDPQTLEIELEDGETAPEVVWSSENESVATVDSNGEVTPVGSGTTLITAALKSDPSIYVKCAVYVQSDAVNNWEFLPADMPTV